MNILIVDDHALFRCGLQMLLQQLVSPIEVEHAGSSLEALQYVAEGRTFDLVMLDWYMPASSGAQSLRMLREALPQGRIVVLSGDQSPALIRQCIEHGAAGFVSKDTPPALLLHALSMITRGGIYLPSEVPGAEICLASPNAYMLANVADCFPALTTRQREVLCAMAQGLPNKRIARALTISEDTVKQHLNVVYGVLNVHTRTEAVYVLSKRGIKVD